MEREDKYSLVIQIEERKLFFTATHYEDDGEYIRFLDKFGKKCEFKKKYLVEKREVL